MIFRQKKIISLKNSAFWKLNPEIRKAIHFLNYIIVVIKYLHVGIVNATHQKIDSMQLKRDDKIYLVDDNMFYVNIFQQHLVNLGYIDVSIFSDPVTCYNQLNPPPDIVFYDHSENFFEDLEVLKMIKKYNPDIYIVFICGPYEVEAVIESLKHGVFDYFIKGEEDVKNIEMVLTKIHRVRQLLQNNKPIRFKKFNSINSKATIGYNPKFY
jgi:DNA-binding NtrC family response regulator